MNLKLRRKDKAIFLNNPKGVKKKFFTTFGSAIRTTLNPLPGKKVVQR